MREAPWRDPARTTKSVGGRVDAVISACEIVLRRSKPAERTQHNPEAYSPVSGESTTARLYGGGEVSMTGTVKTRANLPTGVSKRRLQRQHKPSLGVLRPRHSGRSSERHVETDRITRPNVTQRSRNLVRRPVFAFGHTVHLEKSSLFERQRATMWGSNGPYDAFRSREPRRSNDLSQGMPRSGLPRPERRGFVRRMRFAP